MKKRRKQRRKKATIICPSCEGTGSVNGERCERCDGCGQLKHCCACDDYKARTNRDFARDKHNKDGLHGQCKTCVSIYAATWYRHKTTRPPHASRGTKQQTTKTPPKKISPSYQQLLNEVTQLVRQAKGQQ